IDVLSPTASDSDHRHCAGFLRPGKYPSLTLSGSQAMSCLGFPWLSRHRRSALSVSEQSWGGQNAFRPTKLESTGATGSHYYGSSIYNNQKYRIILKMN